MTDDEYPRTIGMVLLGVFLLGISVFAFGAGVVIMATTSEYFEISRGYILLIGVFFIFISLVLFVISMALFDFKSFFRVAERVWKPVEKFLSRKI